MSFNVIVRGDGTALVTCDHSKIIGGAWIALIDARSIPDEILAKRTVISAAVSLAPDASFADLASISLAQWQSAPVLSQGQFDNLVYESATYRVWVSRMTARDYEDSPEGREAYARERLTIERLSHEGTAARTRGAAWVTLDKYGRENR